MSYPAQSKKDRKSYKTVDAKARGHFRYLADNPPAGTLHGAVLRSPHPHARIGHVDLTAARAIPGVRVVLGPEDVPQDFRYGLRFQDQPVLAQGIARYRGEPVAILAADTAEIAAMALEQIRVAYAPIEAVADPVAALAENSAHLHPTGNLCHDFHFARGDADAALAAAAHRVDLHLETPRQMHAAMELEGGVAWREADGLVIKAPSQDPFYVARCVARLLDIAPERVRVTGSPIGGGFGGKEDLHVQPLIALLAWHADAPVRLVLSRADSTEAGFKRHPFRTHLRIGCDAAGMLLGMAADVVADTGAYASHGPEVLETAMETIQGAYRIPAVNLHGRLAYTNNGISGAFRGFGAAQTQSALEATIDMLARSAGIDPIEFRRRNLAAANADGPLDQDVVPQPELTLIAERLAGLPTVETGAEPRFLEGCGISLIRKGEGFGADGPNGAEGRLSLDPMGRIALTTSLTDMGQGISDAVRAMLADSFDVGPRDVALELGQTVSTSREIGPDSGATSASRGTQIALRLIRKAAPEFRRRLCQGAARLLGCSPGELSLGPGGVYLTTARNNLPNIDFATLAKEEEVRLDISVDGLQASRGHPASHTVFTGCGARAHIEIDRWTGAVRLKQITLVPACGPPQSRTAFDGQMAGGAVQAMGFVLTETLPAENGCFTAKNFDGYFIPSFADAPLVTVDPVTELDPDDPIGLRGAGEIGLNAAAPAILCALYDALGAIPPSLPVQSGWVLAQLDREGLA